MEKTSPDRKRRGFLFTLGVAAPVAGVAGLAAVNAPTQVTAPQAGPVSETESGYHLTDHIRKYYASTAFS